MSADHIPNAGRKAPPEPSAWLYEVRFRGFQGKPDTEWQRYGVFLYKPAAERYLDTCGGGLEGRVTPLYALTEADDV